MGKLSKAEKERVIALIQEGKPLLPKYRSALFAGDDTEYVEATKDYRLIYKGKMPKEEVLRTTRRRHCSKFDLSVRITPFRTTGATCSYLGTTCSP